MTLTLSLPRCHFKTTNKSAKYEILQPSLSFSALVCGRISVRMHSNESTFVIGPKNTLFVAMCVNILAPNVYGPR